MIDEHRTLPADPGAEDAILSAALRSPECVPLVAELSSSDFTSRDRVKIAEAIRRLHARGAPVDAVTVLADLRQHGEPDADVLAVKLGRLLDVGGMATPEHARWYVKTVREKGRRRRIVRGASRLKEHATNGATADELDAELRHFAAEIATEVKAADTRPDAVDLHSPDVTPTRPTFMVECFLRLVGVMMLWAAPGRLKTWLLLRTVLELLCTNGGPRLFGHPDLWINRRLKRVLWIATEETAGVLRWKADQVKAGLLDPERTSEREPKLGMLLYRFAPGERRLTLDDLGWIIERDRPDAIVLDSLTGLRPRTVDGRRISWDLDNDAANDACLALRGLAEKHKLLIVLVHHTGRDTSRYRGATDWWASADAMIGLESEDGRVKVLPEKNRDGKLVAPFYVEPTWADGRFTLKHVGVASTGKLTRTAERVVGVVAARREASQAEIVEAIPDKRRSTIQDAIRCAVSAGALVATGELRDQSPTYRVPVSAGEPDRHPESETDAFSL